MQVNLVLHHRRSYRRIVLMLLPQRRKQPIDLLGRHSLLIDPALLTLRRLHFDEPAPMVEHLQLIAIRHRRRAVRDRRHPVPQKTSASPSHKPMSPEASAAASSTPPPPSTRKTRNPSAGDAVIKPSPNARIVSSVYSKEDNGPSPRSSSNIAPAKPRNRSPYRTRNLSMCRDHRPRSRRIGPRLRSRSLSSALPQR